MPAHQITIVDACCGNGDLGKLFNHHPKVERIVFIDVKKVRGLEQNLSQITTPVEVHLTGVEAYDPPRNTMFIALHACGNLTDKVISLAIDTRSNFVVVPCCYNQNMPPLMPQKIPPVVPHSRRVFYDSCRISYTQEHDYYAEERTLDIKITPMNKIIIGRPKK